MVWAIRKRLDSPHPVSGRLIRQHSQRGSHRKLRNAEGRTVIVPMHRELASGTLRSILRQAGLSAEQLRELL